MLIMAPSTFLVLDTTEVLDTAGGQTTMSNPYHKPSPADAVWTYQGSNAQSRVDFYEKDGCKMDHYHYVQVG